MTKTMQDLTGRTGRITDQEAERILRQLLADAMAGIDIQADDYVVPDGPLVTFVKKP